MDNRNEVIMLKIGDLVKYKETVVGDNNIGLIIKQNCVFRKFWTIRWLNGLEYQENEINLEVVCK